MGESNLINAVNLSKKYKVQKRRKWIHEFLFPKYNKKKALSNINFQIKKNEKIALIGPNGAGKTTLIKILCGLNYNYNGIVSINNQDIRSVKHKIGVMLGTSMIYNRLTGFANLEYYAKILKVKNPKQRINFLCKKFEIGDWINNYVESYSTGMKTKLALARSLIHDPEILILDEPTVGLDPHESKRIREMIISFSKTLILTTHYLPEAEEIANRLIILNKGRIIYDQQLLKNKRNELQKKYFEMIENDK